MLESALEWGITVSTGVLQSVLGFYPFNSLGAVARSDARPPGMRTVAGSILTSGNILSWRLVIK